MNLMPHDYKKTVWPSGYESYTAFSQLLPVEINVRRFSTLSKPFPKDGLFFPKVGDRVKTRTLENAAVHLASSGWKGVNALDGTAVGKTMILCGSGRSIIHTAPLIPKDDDDLIVVAVNGALKAMPPGSVDMYFTLDWLSNVEWWRGTDVEAMHPGIKGVIGLSAPSELASMFKDRYYFAANFVAAAPEAADEFSRQHGFLAECELASHSAMHLAYRMGVTKIILLGHDFACTPGEGGSYYHWDEVVEKEHSKGQEFRAVLDMNDKMTVTTDNLIKNCNIINCTAQACAEDGITVINATEGGILAMPLSMPIEMALAYVEEKQGVAFGR